MYVPGIRLPHGISMPEERLTLLKVVTSTLNSDTHPPAYYMMMWAWTKTLWDERVVHASALCPAGDGLHPAGFLAGQADPPNRRRLDRRRPDGGQRPSGFLEPDRAHVYPRVLSRTAGDDPAPANRPAEPRIALTATSLCRGAPGRTLHPCIFLADPGGPHAVDAL